MDQRDLGFEVKAREFCRIPFPPQEMTHFVQAITELSYWRGLARVLSEAISAGDDRSKYQNTPQLLTRQDSDGAKICRPAPFFHYIHLLSSGDK